MNKKKIGLLSATFLGITSIIGSGWLFAPYKSAVIAGPASILSWIIGAVLVILLALCLGEIASLYPKRGLTAIIPTLSHNKYFGFPFAITNWLGIVAVIGLEADATIQYFIHLFPRFTSVLYHHEQLTAAGNSLSISLVIVYCLLNYWGAGLLAKTNNILAILKLLVPVIVALIIISVVFHPHNFTMEGGTFIPYGIKSVFLAILSSGIIIAFNGFQTIVSFSSEIKNPHKTIPLSLVISIVFCLAVYVLLSVSFIGAIPPEQLANGWQTLKFSAPMIEISLLLGLGFLTTVIYFGATIAPSGTGIAFTGAATRMFTAMSRHGQMPKFFDHLDPVYGSSRRSLIVNILLAILFLLLFRSWSQLAGFLSLLHVVSYLPIPIALCVFRAALKNYAYPFKLWGGSTIALLLFVVFTYLFTLGDFRTITWILGLLALFQLFFMAFSIRSLAGFLLALKQCSLLAIYFIGLWLLTAISPSNGGHLSEELFAVCVTIFSVAFFYGLVRYERGDAELMYATAGIYTEGEAREGVVH